MKSEHSPGSLPEIVEAIAEAYSEARNFVTHLSQARHYKVESRELSVLCVFVSDDEQEELLGDAHEIDRQKRELVDRSDAIRKHGEKLDQLATTFAIACQRITDILEDNYHDLRSFEDGSVTAFQAIGRKFWAVKRWIRETIGFLNLADRFPVALSLEESQKIQDLADGFPIDQAFLTSLDDRLRLEKSVLTQNAKAFAESRGIIGSKTPPRVRQNTEKTDAQQEEAELFKLWKSFSSKKGLPKNKTRAFLEKHKDIGNVYDEDGFKALVDRNRPR